MHPDNIKLPRDEFFYIPDHICLSAAGRLGWKQGVPVTERADAVREELRRISAAFDPNAGILPEYRNLQAKDSRATHWPDSGSTQFHSGPLAEQSYSEKPINQDPPEVRYEMTTRRLRDIAFQFTNEERRLLKYAFTNLGVMSTLDASRASRLLAKLAMPMEFQIEGNPEPTEQAKGRIDTEAFVRKFGGRWEATPDGVVVSIPLMSWDALEAALNG